MLIQGCNLKLELESVSRTLLDENSGAVRLAACLLVPMKEVPEKRHIASLPCGTEPNCFTLTLFAGLLDSRDAFLRL